MFTTAHLSELTYFNNWSSSFHTRFTELKQLVINDPKQAVLQINIKLILSKSLKGSFTIANNQKHETAFGKTIINTAIGIIQGTKEFTDHSPALLVALLYILNLIIDKDKLLFKQKELQKELDTLTELIERI